MNFESRKCVIFYQSMEIGTHENIAIQLDYVKNYVLDTMMQHNCVGML